MRPWSRSRSNRSECDGPNRMSIIPMGQLIFREGRRVTLESAGQARGAVVVVDRGRHATALVDMFAAHGCTVIHLGPARARGTRAVTGARPSVVQYTLDPHADRAWSTALAAAAYLTGRVGVVVDAVSSATFGSWTADRRPAQLDVVLRRALSTTRRDGQPVPVVRITECRTPQTAGAPRYAVETWTPLTRECWVETGALAPVSPRSWRRSPMTREQPQRTSIVPRHLYTPSERLFRSPAEIYRRAHELQ